MVFTAVKIVALAGIGAIVFLAGSLWIFKKSQDALSEVIFG